MSGDAEAPSWLAEHRATWARKPALRRVYNATFDAIRERCGTRGPIVEIGCGPGFFKERFPDVVATDVTPNPHADRIVDAGALPFESSTIGALVLLDVFHHLPSPERFLREAARVLLPAGRIVLFEPWLGLAGQLFYRFVHHEDCDRRVDPRAPWGSDAAGAGGAKDPMLGNVALPQLYFGPRGELDRLDLGLRLIDRRAVLSLPWLLSGGFQELSLLPEDWVSSVEALDRILSRMPRLTATRCLIVVERDSAG